MASSMEIDSEYVNMEEENEEKVDESLYSRQLYVMGHEAQRNLQTSSLLVIGMSGVGVEIAKNTILAGVKKVELYDPDVPNSFDLGGNFYLTEDDVNGTAGRAAICHPRLAELNPYVDVTVSSATDFSLDSVLTAAKGHTCVVGEMQNDNCYNSGGVKVDCSSTAGPHRDLPSPDLTTAELLHFFSSEFGFSTTDTVAIMGAHTLGRLDVDNSGYDGTEGWVGNRRVLDNAYYNDLIGGVEGDDFETQMHAGNWTMNFIDNSDRDTPDRWQWERGDNRFVMVNSDIALVRNLTNEIDSGTGEVANCLFRCRRQNGNGCDKPRCPYAAQTFDIAATFKYDQTAWLVAFESALKEMLTKGADTSGGCATVPCIIESTDGRRRRSLVLRG